MKTISRKRFIEGAAAGALSVLLCLALDQAEAEDLLSGAEGREPAACDGGRPGSSGTGPDYLDGVYHGSAPGRGGRTEVEIIIKDGALSSIEMKHPGNPGLRYYHSPFSMLSDTGAEEGFDLSSVKEASGAVCAFHQAVSQALGQAAASHGPSLSRTADALGPI